MHKRCLIKKIEKIVLFSVCVCRENKIGNRESNILKEVLPTMCHILKIQSHKAIERENCGQMRELECVLEMKFYSFKKEEKMTQKNEQKFKNKETHTQEYIMTFTYCNIFASKHFAKHCLLFLFCFETINRQLIENEILSIF